jgi:SAM-dependent methyltransferase
VAGTLPAMTTSTAGSPSDDSSEGRGGRPGSAPGSDVEAFIARWSASSGAERANYQLFLAELCDLLGVPRPNPSVADEAANTYVFDKAVTFRAADGATSTGYIDLYRRGAFVCETKQSVERPAKDPLSVADPAAPKPRRKAGTSVRGTGGWDDSMIAARGQAEGYVRALPDDNPPFLLVIDIGHSFELYADFSRLGKVYTAFPDARSHRFGLDALRDETICDRLKNLWLDPLALDPARRAAKVTREIAGRIAILARRLEASGHDPESVAWFLIRCLFSFFAEDVGLMPKGAFTDLLVSLRASPEQFVPLVGEVWRTMNTGGNSIALRARIKKFNGGVFAEHEPLKLDAEEIGLLIDAGKSDWQDVEPAIFGTLLERALDARERHKLGAHFTPRAYVERLVVPTIIEPVRDDWEAARAASLAEANAGRLDKARAEARKFLDGLTATRVLDPACGTGNFLYVSMVKLKEIEAEVRDWLRQLGETQADLEHMGHTVDPHQFLGIEINPRAVAIAEVVLWIGWLQWHLRDRKSPDSFSEPILHAYGNIECRDALLEYDKKELVRDEHGKPVTRWDGVTMKKHPVTGEDVPDDKATVAVERYVNPRKAEWPQADFVVGNPPFIGNKRMRTALGDDYTAALRATYDDVPDTADFVMYWWDRAARLTRAGDVRRFGLITTNSITQTFNRSVLARHLDALSSPLYLTFAIPDHPWVGDDAGAAVRIAMTAASCDGPVGRLVKVVHEAPDSEGATDVGLRDVAGRIAATFSTGVDVSKARALQANQSLANQGVTPLGEGFRLSAGEVAGLIAAAPHVAQVIKRYAIGRDIAQRWQEKWIVDLFGYDMPTMQSAFPSLYQLLLHRVKPERDQKKRASYRDKWWVFAEPRSGLRAAMAGLRRFIVTCRTAKHRVFVFLGGDVIPDAKLVAVAHEDAAVLGVLSTRIHSVWALRTGAFLGVGNDSNYNHADCFVKFPFPDATESQRQRIRELGEALDAHRKAQQKTHPGLTITGMYNVLEKLRSGEALTAKEKKIHDDGLVSVLKKIHDDLDAAVFDAYGWPATLTDDEILERLVALNHERAEEEKRGLVRWLRPDFQNKAGAVPLGLEAGDESEEPEADADDEAAEVPKRRRGKAVAKAIRKKAAAKRARKVPTRPWPKDLADQAKLVRALMSATGEVMTPADVARFFTGARGPQVEKILDTLVALGHARRTSSGYAPA